MKPIRILMQSGGPDFPQVLQSFNLALNTKFKDLDFTLKQICIVNDLFSNLQYPNGIKFFHVIGVMEAGSIEEATKWDQIINEEFLDKQMASGENGRPITPKP